MSADPIPTKLNEPMAEPVIETGVAFNDFAAGVLEFTVDVGIVVLFVGMLLALYRVVRGPSLVDRGVATDLIALLSAGMVILVTIRVERVKLLGTVVFERLVMFDAVLIVSILGFVGTVAIAQYIGRRGSAS